MSQENLCVEPDAPWTICMYCDKLLKTCERQEAVNDSYMCPEHHDGVELRDGSWVCSSCYDISFSRWMEEVEYHE